MTISGTLRFDGRPTMPLSWDYTEAGLGLAASGAAVWHGAGAPLARTHRGLVIAWDGRLDNAEDVRQRYGWTRSDTPGDADVALAAFERDGASGLLALIGDWSLAIWDGRRRRLHLARDYMGARPLYYAACRDGVDWSTSLGDLVVRTNRGDALSDRFAAGFLSVRLSAELTPYDGVHAVPPGVCLTFAEDGDRRQRFWRLEPGEIRYRDPREYEARLRALWREAVGVRLRTAGTVWAELSGGLDSSSVVCMADALVREGAVAAPGLRLVSHATLQSPEGDERRFIADVEARVGVRSEIVGVEAHHDDSDPATAWLSPYVAHGVGLETTRRIRAAGGRVVLSGRTGDAVMGCQPDNTAAVFDDLRRLEVRRALRELHAWSRATRRPFVQVVAGLMVSRGAAELSAPPGLLGPRLRPLLDDVPPAPDVAHVRRAKRELARMVLGYSDGARLDVPHRPPDVVYAHPFTHRPLVDFMLAIPGRELSAPGEMRALMRRAFAHLLPPRVLRRTSKGSYPPAAFRSARRLAAAMDPDRVEAVERGWVDRDALRDARRRLVDGGGESGGDISVVLRLEAWLQARRTRFADPGRKEVNSDAVLNA